MIPVIWGVFGTPRCEAEKVVAALDRFRVLVAIHKGHAVGYMDVTHCFDENEPYDLLVLKECRGMGYGKKLMTKALKLNGPKRMMLMVDVDQIPAIQLFESVGFEKKLFAQPQRERYLTLRQDYKLYVGNLRAETKCLGDLRHMDLDVAAEVIKAIPRNRDYGAFYDPQVLPSCQKIINALRGLPQDMVYGDLESIRYRGLEELRVPTRMLEN